MAHVIEIPRDTEREARSFLDALFYSDYISAIGYRPDGEKTKAVAVNWDADQENELDEQISRMISDALETGNGLDEIGIYCGIFPETVLYRGEIANIELIREE